MDTMASPIAQDWIRTMRIAREAKIEYPGTEADRAVYRAVWERFVKLEQAKAEDRRRSHALFTG